MSKRMAILLGLSVLFLAGLHGGTAAAQVMKVGYIDSDRIFTEYSEWSKAQEEFNTDYKAWDEEAQQMQTELEDMMAEYEKQRLILSDAKKKEREAAIEAKRQALDAYTKRVFGPNGEAEKRNNALIKPLLEKINTAIEQLATEENYDFIFNSSGLAYAKKEYDITDKILDILEE
jgi:outer membrane protein